MNPDLDTGHNTSAPARWGELKNANFTGPNQTSSNSTLPQLDITRAISVGLVLGAFILFAIVGNILVILSVACNRHLRTPTNYFIVNLAIADLLLSFTVLPFSAALEVLGYWMLGRIFCDIWAAVDVLCCTASILSLCAISIDRYIGVRYSLQYPTLVTRRKAILALLSVWVLSTVISIGPLLGWKEPAPNDDKECGVTEEPFYALFSSLGSFYIPLAVILVMYCRVYVVAKRTTKNLEAGVMKEMSNSKELTLRIHSKNFHEDTLSSTKAKGHNPRSSIAVKLFKFSREKKAAKTLGIVVGMFILCWLPFFIALPLGSLFSTLKPPDAVFKVVFWLGYFNSCLNPIIYPCSSKEFKRAFLRILGCQCRGRRRRRRRRRRLGGCAYTYRPWTRGGSLERSQSRKDSLDDSGSCLSGSQRTLPSASPSPGYLGRGAPPAVELCAFPEWKAPGALLSLPAPEPPGRRACAAPGPLFTFKLLAEPESPGTDAGASNGQPGFKPNMPLAPGRF
ncbi:alpha-1B adrenergic receptor [Dasypus novemcinctus]|uniref:alpha-1B adrenergic receptor n=1 Tax=Dasypus novemcinctus TaxID=9361 RepID=UPI00265FE240|nr:alpha-1B adrenergic receptor [Dasypus novemcinctus]